MLRLRLESNTHRDCDHSRDTAIPAQHAARYHNSAAILCRWSTSITQLAASQQGCEKAWRASSWLLNACSRNPAHLYSLSTTLSLRRSMLGKLRPAAPSSAAVGSRLECRAEGTTRTRRPLSASLLHGQALQPDLAVNSIQQSRSIAIQTTVLWMPRSDGWPANERT